jgi:hypothetical protein
MAWAGALAALLTLWALACFVGGFFALFDATPVRQVEGLIGLLIGNVAFGCACIVETLRDHAKAQRRE